MRPLFTFIFLLICLHAECQSDWKLEVSKGDMRIYTRKPEGSSLKEYKGVITVNASVDACVKVLSNTKNFPQFMYNVTYAELLQRPSSDEFDVYCVVHFPWPYTDRDMTLNYHFYDMGEGTVKAKLYSVSNGKHLEKYVHLGGVTGSWLFEQITENQTRVTHQSKSSQNDFPDWLVNMFLLDAPKFIMPQFKQLAESGK